MHWVVFLRAVNVGGANRCQPALIAKRLGKLGVVNIGAVGTFVVRENVSERVLRAAVVRELPFKCEIMIVPARHIVRLTSKDPFLAEPTGPDIMRFVSVSAKPLPTGVVSRLRETSNVTESSGFLSLPVNLPSDPAWVIKIIAVKGRFVIGLYRRQMNAISYLAKIEKRFGVPLTTRNWNTIQKIVQTLSKR